MAWVCQGQTIRSERPRIYLDRNTLSILRGKQNGSGEARQQWNRFRESVDAFATPNAHVEWGMAAALLYQMDTKEFYAYGRRACEIGLYNTAGTRYLSQVILQNPNGFRDYGPRGAMIFDWAYDACTDTERTALRNALAETYSYWKTRYPTDQALYRWSNKYGTAAFNTMAMIALALHGTATGSESPQEWLASVVSKYRTSTKVCLESSAASTPGELCYGGLWPEGNWYASETKRLLLSFLEAVRTGTDLDLWRESESVISKLSDYEIHATLPTGPEWNAGFPLYTTIPFRDTDPAALGRIWLTDREVMLRLLGYYQRMRDDTNAGKVKYWLNNIGPYWDMRSASYPGYGRILDFLLDRPEVPEQDYRNRDPLNLITPFGLMSRSHWGREATLVGVLATYAMNQHSHSDSGQFQIYRKGEWLTREQAGYASGIVWPALTGAFAHNTLVLNFHGDYASASRGGASSLSNFPPYGFGKMARIDNGWRTECAEDDHYCYAQMDLGGNYRFSDGNGQVVRNGPDVEFVLRDFLYVKPDLFVVSDRYRFAPGLDAVGMSLVQSESAIAPTLNNGRLTISSPSGRQSLHVNIVAPARAIVRVEDQTRWRLIGVEKSVGTRVFLYVDVWHQLQNGQEVVISGATGPWAILNGSRSVSIPSYSEAPTRAEYKDGVAYNGERFWITLSAEEYASLPPRFDFTQKISIEMGKAWENASRRISAASDGAPIRITSDGHGYTDGTTIGIIGARGNTALNGLRTVRNPDANTFEIVDPEGREIVANGAYVAGSATAFRIVGNNKWYAAITSGEFRNEDSQLWVMEAADSGVAPADVKALPSEQLNAAQFGNGVVGAPKTVWIPDTMQYSFEPTPGATVRHYLLGLKARQQYQVKADPSGQVVIAAGGETTEGRILAASGAGVLAFQTSLQEGTQTVARQARLTRPKPVLSKRKSSSGLRKAFR